MVDDSKDDDSAKSHSYNQNSMSSTTSDNPPPSYTFTQVIDADHLTIQSLATKTRRLLSTIPPSPTPSFNPTSTCQALIPLLQEISWRLIRHDLSESLVMRPAFIAVLTAPQGQQMAEHDRADHANGRIFLLSILDRLEALLGEQSSSCREQLHAISDEVIAAFDDLGKHMAIESGEFLPYFETLIDEETSVRLAREYSASLCMTPYLWVPRSGIFGRRDGLDGSAVREAGSSSQIGLEPIFVDVASYVRMDPARLKAMYEQMVVRADIDEDLRECMKIETERELERLKVWKWRSLSANSNGTKTQHEQQAADTKPSKHITNKL